MNATESGTAYPIRAVRRVCDILDLLQESSDGVILTTIAKHTGMPKSSTFRYLAALEERQYVARDDATGLYHLGLAFRPIQTRDVDRVIEIARPELEKVRKATGETVNLGMLEGTRIVHLAVLESPNTMRLAARVGESLPIHLTAMGKAVAAEMPESEVRAILDAEGMTTLGPRSITDPDEFIEHLDGVRVNGYGVDDCEAQDDGRCVAVAIKGVGHHMAISVSAPAMRLAPEDVPAVGDRLQKAARAVTNHYRRAFGG